MINHGSVEAITITNTGSVGRTEIIQPDPQAAIGVDAEFIKYLRRQALEALMIPENLLKKAGF